MRVDGITPESWLRQVEAFLLMLRANGVASYDGPIMNYGSPIVVAFAPPAEPREDPAVAQARMEQMLREAEKASRCACGHDIHAHNEEDLCLKGCPPSQCSPTTPTQGSEGAVTPG